MMLPESEFAMKFPPVILKEDRKRRLSLLTNRAAPSLG